MDCQAPVRKHRAPKGALRPHPACRCDKTGRGRVRKRRASTNFARNSPDDRHLRTPGTAEYQQSDVNY